MLRSSASAVLGIDNGYRVRRIKLERKIVNEAPPILLELDIFNPLCSEVYETIGTEKQPFHCRPYETIRLPRLATAIQGEKKRNAVWLRQLRAKQATEKTTFMRYVKTMVRA